MEVAGEDELQAAKGVLAAPHTPGHLLQIIQHAPVHHRNLRLRMHAQTKNSSWFKIQCIEVLLALVTAEWRAHYMRKTQRLSCISQAFLLLVIRAFVDGEAMQPGDEGLKEQKRGWGVTSSMMRVVAIRHLFAVSGRDAICSMPCACQIFLSVQKAH